MRQRHGPALRRARSQAEAGTSLWRAAVTPLCASAASAGLTPPTHSQAEAGTIVVPARCADSVPCASGIGRAYAARISRHAQYISACRQQLGLCSLLTRVLFRAAAVHACARLLRALGVPHSARLLDIDMTDSEISVFVKEELSIVLLFTHLGTRQPPERTRRQSHRSASRAP